MSQNKSLPSGFRWADDLPRDSPEPKEPNSKKRGILVNSLQEAIDLFSAKINGYRLDDVKLSGARIGVLFLQEFTKIKYLVLFKREFYIKFSKHFPQVSEKGYGMVSNLKLVQYCAMADVTIAAIFPDGKCYYLSGKEFLSYHEKNNTELPHIPGEIASPLSKWKRLF